MVSFRFRRALLGYNRADVDQAIGSSAAELRNADRRADKAESALSEVRGELDHSRSGLLESRREADARAGRVRELEAVVSWLADRVVDRERELRTVRDELSRDRWGDPERGLAKRTPATGVTAATQAPSDLIGGAAGPASAGPDLVRAAAGPPLEAAAREAVSEVNAAMSAGAGSGTALGSSAAPAEAGTDSAAATAGSNGRLELFEGAVELEIGPLRDFSQLAGFEDAAGAIEGASEITVRRFSKGRATLQLELAEPVELLRELERRAPFDFHVRDTRTGRLVLDVDR